MVKIYNRDGTFKEYDESEVKVITLNADNFLRMENYKNGINIYLKDGTAHFIDNAKTDGNYNFSLTFE